MQATPIPHYVLETSRVPFGYEPTLICEEPSLEEALATIAFLQSQEGAEEFCYETCEA